MNLTLERNGATYRASTSDAHSIAITLDFDGPQANHFGAERAKREPLELGGFVGRTKRGGSCNVDAINLVPHCNGTHTETISHIVDDEIWIGHVAAQPLYTAMLVTTPTTPSGKTSESYRPRLDKADQLVTAASLQHRLAGAAIPKPEALILRTSPNGEMKRSRQYADGKPPAFLTVEAMELIVRLGCRHLLVDLPSVDRMYDDGLLTNHHLFWNVPEGKHAMTAESWQDKTITEMVFVDNELNDGPYLLNLQTPAFGADAAPSRPVIMAASVEKDQ